MSLKASSWWSEQKNNVLKQFVHLWPVISNVHHHALGLMGMSRGPTHVWAVGLERGNGVKGG